MHHCRGVNQAVQMDGRQNPATLKFWKLVVVATSEDIPQANTNHQENNPPEEWVSRVPSRMVPREAVEFFCSEFHCCTGQFWFDIGRALHIRHEIPSRFEVLIIESDSIH